MSDHPAPGGPKPPDTMEALEARVTAAVEETFRDGTKIRAIAYVAQDDALVVAHYVHGHIGSYFIFSPN